MRFLVVDDSRAMQSIIRRNVLNAGYQGCEVKTASDGKQALDIIRKWKPDLVLTDWHMPVMGGMALMEKIHREMLDIKIGFITTETSKERIAAAKAAGALFVIQKPFEQKELSQAIATALQDTTAEKPESENKPATDVSDNPRFTLPSASSFIKIVNVLTQHEVLVEPIPPLDISKKQLPCLVGLFDDDKSTAIRAVCVLELPAACILGGVISDMATTEITEAIKQKDIKDPIFDGCTQLLNTLSAAIYDVNNQKDLHLRSVNIVSKIFPKLKSIYNLSGNRRSDFEVAVLDTGQGLMTIITT